MSNSYTDLEIRILKRQEDGYPVDITLNNSQEFPQGYLNPEILPWVASYSPTEDGERLFAWLLADDRLQQAWVEIRGQSPLRRIRLRLDAAAPELHTLPWELLRDTGPGLTPQTLAADAATPFSRYLAGQWRSPSPILKRPLKLLVALANPDNLSDYNLAALDLKAERDVLESAISASELTDEQLTVTFLEPPVTLSALEAKLRQGYHLLHFVGHGMFDKEQEQAVLFLADRNNQVDLVGGADFAEMLSRQGEILRFVFLASCQTATRSAVDLFRGFAPQLVIAGVPAVMAMQDLVGVDTAREFAGTFYRQLLRHGQVDVASNEARSAVLTAKLSGVSIPVLFMRLPDGALWNFSTLFNHRDEQPQQMEERFLDAAMPEQVIVNEETELVTMIRVPNSEGLRSLLGKHLQLQAQPEDIKSESFELTFPLDERGNVSFLDLWIDIETSDFSLPETRKKIRVQPSKDSEYCIFLLTPRKKGNLRLIIQIYLAETLLASGFVKINGYTKFDKGFEVFKTLITLPLGVFAKGEEKPPNNQEVEINVRGLAEKIIETQQKEEKNQGQGVNISVGGNADLKGVAIGNQNQMMTDVNAQGNVVQAGEGAQVNITSSNSVQQGMSVEEVLKLFEQLSHAVNDVEEVSRKAKIKAKSEVDLAIAEIEEPEDEEPDKEIVAEHLKNATETLKAAGATALQAVTFGKLVGQAVTWLGANYQWLLQLL